MTKRAPDTRVPRFGHLAIKIVENAGQPACFFVAERFLRTLAEGYDNILKFVPLIGWQVVCAQPSNDAPSQSEPLLDCARFATSIRTEADGRS